MYVIVEINGQQFKAEEGKKLFVHHIQNAAYWQIAVAEEIIPGQAGTVGNIGTWHVGKIDVYKRQA